LASFAPDADLRPSSTLPGARQKQLGSLLTDKCAQTMNKHTRHGNRQ
jgi:hypothetical protein